MTIKDRLKQFINHLEIEVRTFEIKAGLSNGFVNNVGSSLREGSLEKLLSTYPELNKIWLLTGDGSMIKGQKMPKFEAEPLRLADPFGFEATGQKFYTLADGSEVMQIPVVPVKAWGSYPMGYADPEFYDGFESITVPVNKLHKGMYLSFEMKGESMVNIETKENARKSLWPGQKVIGRDIRREAWQYKLHISEDEAWIIVHKDDGITVKEISDHDIKTGILTLHSWNPDKIEHPDFQWHVDDIQQIFHVVDPFAKMKPY